MPFMSDPLSKAASAVWDAELPASIHSAPTVAAASASEDTSVSATSSNKPAKNARRASIMPPGRATKSSQDDLILAHLSGEANIYEDSSVLMLDDVLKATLSDLQKTSKYFHGFTDEDIDAFAPFLTHFPFNDGDLLAQKGEPATWCGVLLKGSIATVEESASGAAGRVLSPGTVVGEMSLFRGGTRFCDLVGKGNGALAALRYEDIPQLYEAAPSVAHRLIACFGRSATCKLVQPHPPPSGLPLAAHTAMAGASSGPPASAAAALLAAAGGASSAQVGGRGKRGSVVAADPAVRMRVVSQALQRRGLSEDDSNQLLQSMLVEEYPPHSVILKESTELRHIGVVVQGSVVEGEVSKGAGELVGAWFALSGHPVHLRVVAGAQGATLGCLTLEHVRELASSQGDRGELALKALKLIGIGATAQAEEQSEEDEFNTVSSALGAKLTEVLYRNKIKDVEARASVMQDEAGRALHDKQRNAILLKKVQRAHGETAGKLTEANESIASLKQEKSLLESTLKKRDKELAAMASKAEALRQQLDVSQSGLSQEDSGMATEMLALRDELASRDGLIGELRESLDAAAAEREAMRASFEDDYHTLQRQSQRLHSETVTKFRWRVFILLLILEKKRAVERRYKTRNQIVEWLSGKKTQENALSLDSIKGELAEARVELRRSQSESAELRVAADEMASARSHLEAQQSELVRTTREALGNGEHLASAAEAAEERAAHAATRMEELVAERLHLRWAVREAEERGKEHAAEAAKLVAERDAAQSDLFEARKGWQQSSGLLHASQKQCTELEATLLADRQAFAARVAEAERTARDGAEALSRTRRLEARLDAANVARAAEGVLHDKQRLMLDRLLELEGTFGAVLAPSTSASTPYSLAVQDLTRDELRIPARAVRKHAAARGEYASPLLEVPFPGREAHHAALAAASNAALLSDEASPPKGGVPYQLPSPSSASMKPEVTLPTSTSLPALYATKGGAGAGAGAGGVGRPLPVARGAARVAQRKGISVGSRSELKQIVAARARAVGP